MKLPALWIAAAVAAGIVLAGVQPARPAVWLAFTAAAILAGFGCVRRQRLALAWSFGLAAWVFLGALAASFENMATPPHHVTRLLPSGNLDTSEPLRWRGQLRSDPVQLPWGFRCEVDLDEVEAGGQPFRISGGLRLTYFRNERAPEARPGGPPLRAGDRVEALVRARPPRNYLNPGAFDARAQLARIGIHLLGTLRSTELLRQIEGPPPSLAHRFARLRGTLLERLDRMYAAAPEHAAVLRAMLLGDYSFIDHDLAEVFQKTAVYHVLVISGLHVAALAAFVFWIARRLRLSLGATTLLTLAVLALFVALVEDRPPIARAALMALIFLSSRLLFRRVELLNTIAVAALLLLFARPSALADPSFQLSFLAVAMIGALAMPWVEGTSGPYRRALGNLSDVTRDAVHAPRATQMRLDLRAAAEWLAARLPTRLAGQASGALTAPTGAMLRLWEVLLVSATIQLGMLPVMVHYFHRVSAAGPLANIPATLLSGLIVPLGFLALGAGAVWAWLGAMLAKLLGALVAAMLVCVEWFGEWTLASYRVPGPPAWLTVAFFGSVVWMAVAARSSGSRWWKFLAGAALILATLAVATYPFAPQLARGRLELTILDVGQGDAIFTAFPDGRTMLIDGGGLFGATRAGGFRTGFDIGEQVVSPYLWHRGVKRLDVIALTHAHQDHLDGLNAVLNNFQVGELWVGRDVDTPAYRALLEHASARGARVVHRRRGDSFTWDEATGLVLWPEDRAVAEKASNNDSLVLRLEHGAIEFLLPGDIEREVEAELVARGDPLPADFLKLPHHGSRTSSTDAFVTAVAARLAAVSVSDANPFGHPHPEVLERLRERGVRVLRTDRDGAVTLTSDARSLLVQTFASLNPR